MKINNIEIDEAAVLAVLTDEQKARLTEVKDEQYFILYRPQREERYLYLNGLWAIDAINWRETQAGKRLWDIGFIAPKTPEGRCYLEHKRDQHLAKVRLQRWIASHATEKIDWRDRRQPKYFPVWDTKREQFVAENYLTAMANPDGICAASKDAECFLKECEIDLKIYFGV